jgi:hypothetical protein
MARGANLRLSNSVLGQLANPNFARSAGMSIGAGMLGAQRREQEAEKRATEETTLELLRKAQVAQEQGDMRLLNEVTQTLDGMLTGTKSEGARTLLTQGISTVSGQRASTQAQQQTNTAKSILATEQALEQYQNQVGPLSDSELKAQKALQQRILVMKQNGAAVAEAATIQYKSDVQALERDAALREKRIVAGSDALASLNPEDEQYKNLANSLESAGLGKAVRQDKKARQEIKKAEGEIRAQQLETGPLTESEMATAKKMGLTITDPKEPLSRKLFNAAMETKIKEEVRIAVRPISTPEKPRAEAIVKAQLRAIAREGDYVDFFWERDIATKIEDMSEDQINDLMGRVAGLSEAEVPNEVNAWLFENFPSAMKRSGKFAAKNQRDAEDIGALANSILKGRGISIADATEEQRAVAQREAELAISGAESALQRQQVPASGGEGRRQRRGKLEVAEPYTIERRTGTGGQMNRRQKP